MERAIGAKAIPALGYGHRAGRVQRASDIGMPVEFDADRRVVRRAQDASEFVGAEPSAHNQVGSAERARQRRHLLAKHGRCASHAAARRADLSRGGLQVEGEADRGRVPFAGRPGSLDEVAVGGRRPAVVFDPMPLPPLGETGARVGEGALSDLESRNTPGSAGAGEHTAPAGDTTMLLAGIEERERRMRHRHDRGEGLRVRVVDP